MVALALGSLLTVQTGCVVLGAGAAGAGAMAYLRGELAGNLEARFSEASRAAEGAIKDLEFTLVENRGDALTRNITARTADDKKVEIKLSSVSSQLTKIQIRVGIFGDETISLAILERIKARL